MLQGSTTSRTCSKARSDHGTAANRGMSEWHATDLHQGASKPGASRVVAFSKKLDDKLIPIFVLVATLGYSLIIG